MDIGNLHYSLDIDVDKNKLTSSWHTQNPCILIIVRDKVNTICIRHPKQDPHIFIYLQVGQRHLPKKYTPLDIDIADCKDQT